jgi:diguanylate cyclase (GGDEF)-like protein/PAS domain S-box-containing protein
LIRLMPLAFAYFIAASLAVAFTRFDGGFAFIWGASALLIAALVRLPRRRWGGALALCGLASFLATGWFGLGWAAAPYFVVVNLAEGLTGAWLMRQNRGAGRALESLDWLIRFVLAVGIAAPLAAGLLAIGWMAPTGQPLLGHFLGFFYGHSLGNLTFTPLAMLVMGPAARRSTWNALSQRRGDAVILLPLLLVTTLTVFHQHRLPLLFLPILPVMLIAFRTGREGAALSVAILALVGGALTAAGVGPTLLIGGSLGYRLLFFQFYLATTVLTVLPLTADLQQRRRLNSRVRDSEERYRLLAEYSTDIIMKLEDHGRILYVSPSIRQFGYSPDELIGRNCAMLIDADHLPEATRAHLETIDLAGRTNRFEYLAVAKDGSRHWCETHARMIVDHHGRFDGMVSIVRGIDDRKRNEERLAKAAMTDPLTGLANRRAFCEAAQTDRRQSDRSRSSCIALFDIDHFKRVNDRHGHNAGDEVLRCFAHIAAKVVRREDLVARIGGEEFAVMFPDTSIEHALMVCERLRAEVASTPIRVGGSTIAVTVSGGVAILGPAGLDDALKQADKALYHAKDGGRDQLALAA